MVCTYLMSFYMSMRTISITALKILTAIFVPYQNPIIPRFKYDKERSVICVMYVIRKVIEMKLALACQHAYSHTSRARRYNTGTPAHQHY